MVQYECPAVVDCPRADNKEVFEFAVSDEHRCPQCNTLLVLKKEEGSNLKQVSLLVKFIGVGIVSVILACCAYFYILKTKAPVVNAPTTESITVLLSSAKTSSILSGMTPSEEDTQTLKKASQDRLKAGDAASAELASAKAITNEMLKLAISKMAQGKFNEADKALSDARSIDPKQPLIYYNTAILRLKQNRVDDALKEFETSFIVGFLHFDKMDQDPDLDNLRKDLRFTKLVDKYRILLK